MMNYMVAGIPLKRIVRYSTVAAVTGLGSGKCWRNLQEHPGTGHQIINYSIVGGLVGSVVGLSVGAWVGRGVMMLVFSQSMYGSLLTACYCNIHAVITNAEMKLPNREVPINNLVTSSLSGGVTGSLLGLLPGSRIINMCIVGMAAGFFGHFGFERLRIVRLEFLLHENYPELVSQVREVEEWMDNQCRTNPYYAGPVNPKPEWVRQLASLWGDFGKRNPQELRKEFES